MKKNVIKEKSFAYAVEIVYIYKWLLEEKNEQIMSKQLLRSGTSVRANVREAEQAQSRPDFISKLSIALKEANESEYWIELLKETNYLDKDNYNRIKPKIEEVLKLLISIIKSARK
ncbi:four helix bundle protein [Zhouia amylolytica]|uniref:Four helix bundle protein n=1 Tax=Zhouia amylolytica AD3 TaxID=1286632 RepID=W2UK55_9FLAO|nr:four helix bundle protein [Zhouia amylolytica]ETN93821.1 hypothetical protein P278_32310 [Zhouia amylolytica AD3]